MGGWEEEVEGYKTYELLELERLPEELDELICFISSSRWTAVEKRFQKFGSWTRAIFAVIR
jgi:hypothetical protein